MDLLGVNSSIDRAADRMQSLVDGAREAAFALELQTNKHATERIEQIDKMIKSAIRDIHSVQTKMQDDIDKMLSKYVDEFKELERDIFAELSKIIQQIECAIDKSASVYVQDMLGGIGRLLDTNTFEVEAPPLYLGEQECGWFRNCRKVKKTFKINSADFAVTYRELRDYLLARLENSRDDTPISSVLRSYNIIANAAKRAGCLTGLHQAYASEARPYMSMIKTWEFVTGEPGVSVP